MGLSAGTRLGSYEIVASLGAGGMGEVYRARDLRLGREVALKVLPADVASHPDRLARFEREARIVAGLSHPNIVVLYAVEDVAGVRVLTMELIEGQSLDTQVTPGGLPLERVLDIGIALSDALASAHGKGVVHRDLKPANVMLTREGRVKVLDFGLAKLAAETSGALDATQAATLAAPVSSAGLVVGTVPYMAPEQVRGEAVDARTDLFALGIILYELATGTRPFRGATWADVSSAILRDNPPPITSVRDDLTGDLARLVSRCLQKKPCDRFRTASDVLDELRRIRQAVAHAERAAPAASRDATTAQVSLVVLPFANLSPEPDTDYFSDGLTDEIITDLSRIRSLRVISRSSAMRFKGDTRGLAAIGRDLGCRYVLEGSVRRAANALRITARLVDAPHDTQVWADKYAGSLDDVFDIQERVSRSIVDALQIRLTPQEAEQLAERPIADVRAQECYLRARSEIWSFLPGSLDRAVSHLEAALRLIGDNALVYQGLGEAYYQYVNIGAASGREEEYIRRAEECADRIFALESESPRGYHVRATVQLARGDIHGCARSLRRVLQVYPKDVSAMFLYTHVLGWLGGKPDAAARLASRLLDVDPLSAVSLLVSAMVPLFAGRFAEALEPARRMFDLDPVTPVWRANYVMALSFNRRLDEAEALTKGVVAQPDSDLGTWWMGMWRAAWRADRAEVLRLADSPYQQAAEWDQEIPWILAGAHAAVGETEKALYWLDRTIDRGMINYPFLSEHDLYLENIRGEARFQQAMERARREWERLEV